MKLSKNEILDRLKKYSAWEFSGDSIFKEFSTENFSKAIAFVVEIGIEAEKLDHHPDINLHSWNKVKITLSTHGEGGVTDKDFELLTKIENIKL